MNRSPVHSDASLRHTTPRCGRRSRPGRGAARSARRRPRASSVRGTSRPGSGTRSATGSSGTWNCRWLMIAVVAGGRARSGRSGPATGSCATTRGRRAPGGVGLGLVRADAEDVVDVAVREDDACRAAGRSSPAPPRGWTGRGRRSRCRPGPASVGAERARRWRRRGRTRSGRPPRRSRRTRSRGGPPRPSPPPATVGRTGPARCEPWSPTVSGMATGRPARCVGGLRRRGRRDRRPHRRRRRLRRACGSGTTPAR